MISSAFSMLFAKITAVLQWFGDLFISIFVALWDIFKDVFCWVFDQSLSIVTTAVSAVDVSAFAGLTASMGSIPASVSQVLSCIGVGTAFTAIAAALAIRFGLQLIPFVRLGS